nr:MAG TPA: hypothetical protein [Bacteriophage sp.]
MDVRLLLSKDLSKHIDFSVSICYNTDIGSIRKLRAG